MMECDESKSDNSECGKSGNVLCDEHVSDADLKVAFSEGKAEILATDRNIFYNPVQEFNRDLSVAVLALFAEEFHESHTKKECSQESIDTSHFSGAKPEKKEKGSFTIFEALSASGLRSIRYAKEVPGVNKIVANDISKVAVEAIIQNIKHNQVEHLVSCTNYDASLLMHENTAKGHSFTAIDLDPYGCPSKFLDAAVQNVEDGGILLITCTDMAILCGNTPETCYIKYGSIPLRSSSCHEMAIRIALQCIESHANRYGRFITPLLSFSADFYIRMMVKVQKSQATCKKTLSKLSHVYQCVGCKCFELFPLGLTEERDGKPPKFLLPHVPQLSTCKHCQSKLRMGGPIWNAPLVDNVFVSKLLGRLATDWADKFTTRRRMEGMLFLLREELDDSPLYYTVESLCSVVHCTTIPLCDFRSALLNAGFKVSLSHAARNSVKSDADSSVFWDIVRTWVNNGHPVSAKRITEGSVAAAILCTKPKYEIDFKVHPLAHFSSNILRYQMNPLRNWGPGMRSVTRVANDGTMTVQPNKKLKKNMEND